MLMLNLYTCVMKLMEWESETARINKRNQGGEPRLNT